MGLVCKMLSSRCIKLRCETKHKQTNAALWFSGLLQDVAWHCHHPDIFGSVGDDKHLILWDTRSPPSSGDARCACVCVIYLGSMSKHPDKQKRSSTLS